LAPATVCYRWGPSCPHGMGHSSPSPLSIFMGAGFAGWIKMPFGTEVRPWPRPHGIRWGPSSSLPPEKRGTAAPIFRPCLLWPNGWVWIKMKFGMEVNLDPGHNVSWGPSSPPQRGTAPIFGPCLLWPNGRPSQLLLSTCCRAHDRDKPTFLTDRRPDQPIVGHTTLLSAASTYT